MKRLYALVLFFAGCNNLYAQNQNPDTLKTYELAEVKVFGKKSSYPLGRMPEVEGTQIFSGKKNEIISVESLNADLSINNSRQIFARIPGVMVWENDGSGIQTSVSTRGLSPNRSWEFNVRQNGYDISSEVFGYPE
nr:TonB-dependent receptor [Flammeovirgaceae bacterium]